MDNTEIYREALNYIDSLIRRDFKRFQVLKVGHAIIHLMINEIDKVSEERNIINASSLISISSNPSIKIPFDFILENDKRGELFLQNPKNEIFRIASLTLFQVAEFQNNKRKCDDDDQDQVDSQGRMKREEGSPIKRVRLATLTTVEPSNNSVQSSSSMDTGSSSFYSILSNPNSIREFEKSDEKDPGREFGGIKNDLGHVDFAGSLSNHHHDVEGKVIDTLGSNVPRYNLVGLRFCSTPGCSCHHHMPIHGPFRRRRRRCTKPTEGDQKQDQDDETDSDTQILDNDEFDADDEKSKIIIEISGNH